MDLERRCAELTGDRAKSAAQRLHTLFAAAWEWEMVEYPERATWTGFPGQNHRWSDRSRAAIERRRREIRAPLAAARALPRQELSPADQLNLDVFARGLERTIEEARWPAEWLALTQMDGIHQDPAQLLALMPGDSQKQLEELVARLEGLPALVEQATLLLREGLAKGVTPPRICLRDVPKQVENLCVKEAAKSPMLAAFAKATDATSSSGGVKLKRDAEAIFTKRIVPSLEKLRAFLAESYLPGARESVAWSALPDGEAWYAFQVREQTTTKLTAAEIHAIGVAEVKRIRAEMDAIVKEAGFGADFRRYCEFLRSDRRFYFESPQELLTAYRDLCKRIDPELVRLFGKLPRLPYGVVEVPAFAAESQTTAYYLPGSPQAGRPGYYYANTSKLDSRPKWEMEALSLHEAVPGHHLQIALAQELDLPEFRRHANYNAYVEGWALYSESLGGEVGLYTDLHSRFGRCSYEMWRAIRLVVDTGIHAFGWSRERAIEFFAGNTSKPLHDVTVEVDRYIVWPAQALSYKIGELEIRKLRREAEAALGKRFDLRAFHDELLCEGALPLDLLAPRIRGWIAAR
jgi:uncharacterized protein (DUF885 family)